MVEMPLASRPRPMTLLPISDQEMADLIRISAGRTVAAVMTTRGLRLNVDLTPWALSKLGEWRGLLFTDGGGI